MQKKNMLLVIFIQINIKVQFGVLQIGEQQVLYIGKQEISKIQRIIPQLLVMLQIKHIQVHLLLLMLLLLVMMLNLLKILIIQFHIAIIKMQVQQQYQLQVSEIIPAQLQRILRLLQEVFRIQLSEVYQIKHTQVIRFLHCRL